MEELYRPFEFIAFAASSQSLASDSICVLSASRVFFNFGETSEIAGIGPSAAALELALVLNVENKAHSITTAKIFMSNILPS